MLPSSSSSVGPSADSSPNMARVQEVVRLAAATFTKGKASSYNLDRLRKSMSILTKDDFNIAPSLADSRWDFPPYVVNAPASCMDVYECEDFSVGIFFLKPNKTMPFHDHPGMHGIMKVLFGSMTVTSYSKPGDQTEEGSDFPARFRCPLASRQVLDISSDPCTLLPHDSNIHEIVANDEPVAFLDLLSPPYNPSEGRDCTYYLREKVDSEPDLERVAWLRPGPNPSWFSCVPLAYSGPKVS